MSRYVYANEVNGDALWRPFPPGRCQWCGEALPKRCRSYCPPNPNGNGPWYGSRYSACAVAYSYYWYSSPRIRRAILLRDNFTCQQCGIEPKIIGKDGIVRPKLTALHVDHIMPYSRGGSRHEGNLQLLCAPCNLAKGAKGPGVHGRQGVLV